MKYLSCVISFLLWGVCSVQAEFFFDLYGGLAHTQKGHFSSGYSESSTFGGGSSGAYTESDLEGANSGLIGLRGGAWFGEAGWLGAALDLSYFKIDAPNSVTTVEVTPISFLFMLRYPLGVSANFPNGRAYPYFGLGPFFAAVDISSEVSDSYDERDVDGEAYGMDLRTGMMWRFSRELGVFVEYRYTTLRFEEEDEWQSGGFFLHRTHRVDTEGKAQTHHVLAGLSLAF